MCNLLYIGLPILLNDTTKGKLHRNGDRDIVIRTLFHVYNNKEPHSTVFPERGTQHQLPLSASLDQLFSINTFSRHVLVGTVYCMVVQTVCAFCCNVCGFFNFRSIISVLTSPWSIVIFLHAGRSCRMHGCNWQCEEESTLCECGCCQYRI